MTQKRFELLDVMRGIAALAVMFGHINGLLGDPRRTDNTGLAVDFFFCLSGFVVAHAYGERLQSGALPFWRFVRKRFIRLYPMAFAGGLLGLAAHLYVDHEVAWRDGIASLLLLPRLDGFLAFPLDVPMWSLPYELAASIAFAVIIKICPRLIPWALAASGAMLCACVLLAGHVNTFGVGSAAGLAKGGLRIAYPFLLGVLVCHFHDRLPRVPDFVAPLALVALLMPVTPWTGPYQAFAVMLGLPLVLVAGVNASVDKRLLFLERLSYPLYLVHWPVILAVHHGLQGRMATPAIAAVLVGAACATAWIVLIAYDEPARRWLGRHFDGRQSARLEPQPANLTAS